MHLGQYAAMTGSVAKRITCLVCALVCLGAFRVTAARDTERQVRTFFLEGVRSGKLHGPFTFQTGTAIELENRSFRLDVLTAAGSFILTEQQSGTVFGVYELVPGRIIDAGYQLFTITRVASKPLPPGQAPVRDRGMLPPPRHYDPFHQSPYRVGVTMDLINRVAYNWKLDDQDGGSAKYMERRGARLSFSRGIVTLAGGFIATADWQETIQDPDGQFERGTLSNGSGWEVELSLLIPVFTEGRWSASVGGGVTYQRETYDLEYGQWQTIILETTTPTNGVSNGVTNGVPETPPPVSVDRFVRQKQSATLSETMVNLTARLDYTAPHWFAYAGLHATPWSDTDMQAFIEIDDQRIPLSFDRRDPFSGYAGVGFTYQDVHSYLEMEAGGVNAIRLGMMLSF